MIPKIIHYCWFGGNELSKDAKKYIEIWHSLCPEYQIIEWNETNFDVESVPYVREAYEQRKWAFVSDYARLYALKKYGGIYLDTDVEILKPLDALLYNKAFIGAESKYSICTAVIGAEKDASFIGELMSLYDGIHFVNKQKIDLTPNSQRVFEYLKSVYDYKDVKIVHFIRRTIFLQLIVIHMNKKLHKIHTVFIDLLELGKTKERCFQIS